MKNRLDELDAVTIYGSAKEKCGIFSMNLNNIHHYDAAMILDQMGIAIRSGALCAQPLMDHFNIKGTIRASLALYNTKRDIDVFIDGLKQVQEVCGAL